MFHHDVTTHSSPVMLHASEELGIWNETFDTAFLGFWSTPPDLH